jgi:hypothetical protein
MIADLAINMQLLSDGMDHFFGCVAIGRGPAHEIDVIRS